MIIREWTGRAHPDMPEAYPRHFRNVVVPELRAIPGFRGAVLTRRAGPEGITFTVLTHWESHAAVCAFAGADPDRAVVEPGAIAALADYDDTVRHHEVIEDIVVPSPGP